MMWFWKSAGTRYVYDPSCCYLQQIVEFRESFLPLYWRERYVLLSNLIDWYRISPPLLNWFRSSLIGSLSDSVRPSRDITLLVQNSQLHAHTINQWFTVIITVSLANHGHKDPMHPRTQPKYTTNSYASCKQVHTPRRHERTLIQRDRRLQEHGRGGQKRGPNARRGAAAEATGAATVGVVSPDSDAPAPRFRDVHHGCRAKE